MHQVCSVDHRTLHRGVDCLSLCTRVERHLLLFVFKQQEIIGSAPIHTLVTEVSNLFVWPDWRHFSPLNVWLTFGFWFKHRAFHFEWLVIYFKASSVWLFWPHLIVTVLAGSRLVSPYTYLWTCKSLFCIAKCLDIWSPHFWIEVLCARNDIVIAGSRQIIIDTKLSLSLCHEACRVWSSWLLPKPETTSDIVATWTKRIFTKFLSDYGAINCGTKVLVNF